jgi:hypothetical protein
MLYEHSLFRHKGFCSGEPGSDAEFHRSVAVCRGPQYRIQEPLMRESNNYSGSLQGLHAIRDRSLFDA